MKGAGLDDPYTYTNKYIRSYDYFWSDSKNVKNKEYETILMNYEEKK